MVTSRTEFRPRCERLKYKHQSPTRQADLPGPKLTKRYHIDLLIFFFGFKDNANH